MQESIIVYRSRQEQAYDQFISENPEYVLAFLGMLVLTVIAYKIYQRFRR